MELDARQRELLPLILKLFDDVLIGAEPPFPGINGIEGGCFEFDEDKATSNRYARVRDKGKTILGHRLSWEFFVGPIPSGNLIHHRCENTLCVRSCIEPRWSHLEPITRSDHGIEHLSETCPRCGGTNWRYRADNGRRECRDCANRRRREWAQRTGYQ